MQKKKKTSVKPPLPSPLGAGTWKIALKYEVKQSKKGQFTSNYKARPIDFETQIPPPPHPVVKPLKKALWKKYKPGGLYQ